MSIEELKARAAEWLAPIEGAAPAGSLAKLDKRYERVVQETAKLDSPTGGAVDWNAVVASGGELLKSCSKDLLIASYFAYALFATRGLAGLTTGCVVLSEMMADFWEGLFPEVRRLRGRANALTWFFERAAKAIETTQVKASQRADVEQLAEALKRLSDVTREKLDAQAPSARNFIDAVERLRLSLPDPAAAAVKSPALAPTPTPTVNAPSAVVPVTTAAATTVVVSDSTLTAPPPVAPPAAGADPTDFLRSIGTSLIDAASVLRAAVPADPVAYRILRTGLWLHMTQPPPADGDKTRIAPLPADLRSRLDLMANNAKWTALIEESESALEQSRFALDLQRTTAMALKSLGDGYQRARDAVIIELRALLQRMPALRTLRFSDGSPFADGATAAWIETEVLGAASTGKAPSAADPSGEKAGDEQAVLAEARKLIGENRLADAVAAVQARVATSPTGAARFRLRLHLAKLYQDAGQAVCARMLFEALDNEACACNLDDWDPALAAECLAGLLNAATKTKTGDDNLSRHMRLVKLDPIAAMKIVR